MQELQPTELAPVIEANVPVTEAEAFEVIKSAAVRLGTESWRGISNNSRQLEATSGIDYYDF